MTQVIVKVLDYLDEEGKYPATYVELADGKFIAWMTEEVEDNVLDSICVGTFATADDAIERLHLWGSVGSWMGRPQ